MNNTELEKLADLLTELGNYQVIRKYQKPAFYNLDSEDIDLNNTNKPSKSIGVFLDIESTGLSDVTDKIIELAMVKFEYTEDGRIFRLLDEFNQYQDPYISIPAHIVKLTGITDEMVKGHQIDETQIVNYLADVDLIIAHNAKFDRAFFETTFPFIPVKPWACMMFDVDWKLNNIASHKLEYIAYKYGFFFEGHRALIDCLAGIHILSQELPISQESVLKQLLRNSGELTFKIWALHAHYDHKDSLKARNYRWSNHPNYNYKAWAIELPENQIEEEIEYLRSTVYKGPIELPVEIYDSYSRFSNRYNNHHHIKTLKIYHDKIEWIKKLCLKS